MPRGFTCWQQFVAMMFCQLAYAQSLREICGGLAALEGKLRHLGIADCPKAMGHQQRTQPPRHNES
jgi:hypothetical protein